MRRLVLSCLAALLAVLGLSTASSQASSGSEAPRPARVTVIQAVPGAIVDVSIDGSEVAGGSGVGDVLGPFELSPGSHDIGFTGDGLEVDTTLDVRAGAASDVVLHLPAEVDGDPVVHSYAAPDGPIGPGKARVLLAHTATVAPADVQVDGQTVFTNIANGEYADADVPEGTIEVALLPSGTTEDPILGPLDVTLEASTLSMIYAYGNPRDGSMNVIAHTSPLGADGSVTPERIDTGSAGLASASVTTFGGDEQREPVFLGLLALAAVVAGIGAIARLHTAARRRVG
ncbi:DUF4397 domain-containing protein [Nocardioides eburneiflavus]|uniref:DUF4397 domain-containing protein n=1 Tax=Nocardioides eburneiflavus TaxID=2518372 RepID=A0A4Z1CE89_9ACTN|nr:DUF4397 domain-containing protein [Nocardioides eburneiflavus]TGN66156.1 DUF4397 domain-containing protein [Nocardioides eburneiflavus]